MDFFAHFKIWVLILCLIFQSGHGFYLPGSYPHKHGIGDTLSVKVNSITSIETEMPFSYYSLPFCKPLEGVKDSAENLGECQTGPLSGENFKLLKKRIDEMYQVNLMLDNLPAIRYAKKDSYFLRWTGYPVGIKIQDAYYVFNHLKFTVLVHKYEEANVARVMGTGDAAEVIPTIASEGSELPGYMVVGFEVVPCSVMHDAKSVKNLKPYEKYPSPVKCDPTTVAMPIKENEPIVFTYEVKFEESDIKWPSRWDAYLKMEGSKVHWFSILNSLMVITFLAGIVLVIFLRTVRRDLTRYEELDKEAQAQMNEELSGWKLVVGDVFRAPTNAGLLCVMVGDGVQLLGMAVVTVLFASLGFMSPASRGTLIIGMILFYMILGISAGYVAVRLWRTIGRGDKKGWISVSWKLGGSLGQRHLILNTLFEPTRFLGKFQLKNIHLGCWSLELELFLLARSSLSSSLSCLASGWGRVYYVFGFLLIVFILLVVVCAEVSLVLTYMHLCVEDWKWWWKSFFASGSVAIYIFLYSVNYLIFELKSLSGPTSEALYLGYSILMALAIMFAMGSVGFLSSFWWISWHDSMLCDAFASGIVMGYDASSANLLNLLFISLLLSHTEMYSREDSKKPRSLRTEIVLVLLHAKSKPWLEKCLARKAAGVPLFWPPVAAIIPSAFNMHNG
ncbi:TRANSMEMBRANE 9 SUPERFAMILY MEMBER [Salix viminalis]|uniref:Transmembrane 9 superfamily member n=1 Tax=Salix viminalis TaxID=40686 RepID=A0A9Q0NP50_SALVM|nr:TRANSMEMBRANE 9 SUPERFAMILY MEMBER [Salix viminalis]